MQLLAGTYTRGTQSDGVYLLEFDSGSGRLGEPDLVVQSDNPSWLLLRGNRLLAVNEHADREKSGEITVFEREADGFRELQRLSSYGADPCHLALTESRLAVANYSGGTVALYSWLGERAGDLIAIIRPNRHGAHPRQKTPHPHGVYFLDGKLYVPDLGGDCIYVHDAQSGTAITRIDVPAGSGPRHLSPGGRFLVTELANTVLPVSSDTSGAAVSTLPEDSESRSATAEIQALGDKLYVSNRGDDSIAVLETDPELRVVQHRSTEGSHPRHFYITADGCFLLVANKDSNNIVCIRMSADGELQDTVCTVGCPSPVHLVPGPD